VLPREVGGIDRAKGEAGLQDDEAAGVYFALSGLVVRHGDIIDAITPTVRDVSVSGDLGQTRMGRQYGGDGGGVTRLAGRLGADRRRRLRHQPSTANPRHRHEPALHFRPDRRADAAAAMPRHA
jgi:hypothetical protein